MNVQHIKDMLEQWTGQALLLTKEEGDDTDRTVMKLESVDVVERGGTIDGYVSPFVLQLRGNGYALVDDGRKEPLPNDTYDIALGIDNDIHADSDSVFIETARATYSIARRSPYSTCSKSIQNQIRTSAKSAASCGNADVPQSF